MWQSKRDSVWVQQDLRHKHRQLSLWTMSWLHWSQLCLALQLTPKSRRCSRLGEYPVCCKNRTCSFLSLDRKSLLYLRSDWCYCRDRNWICHESFYKRAKLGNPEESRWMDSIGKWENLGSNKSVDWLNQLLELMLFHYIGLWWRSRGRPDHSSRLQLRWITICTFPVGSRLCFTCRKKTDHCVRRSKNLCFTSWQNCTSLLALVLRQLHKSKLQNRQ